ncbi:unnamed protein product [Caenorhabditis bovis]|uniref:Glycoside hydrolase 35 catalytic domain-containing protein n=1 Tax=Caenorhabditis bovis TaxID=2654633 RepID=A0A8S1FFE4_9PELO|nr:unnamed protein product [Caenorhabditis bovis]
MFSKDSSPSFKIDAVNRQFLLDGDPFRYIAGEIHYFRIPHQKWDDRLKRVRSLGLNAITVPVPWNLHQFEEDLSPKFTGNLDLIKFINTANENGLYTILRIGPYISAEWDNGGLPWWLLRRDRSDSMVDLLPKMFPLMRRNGGPILMVQIEHMYGDTGLCDQSYLLSLVNYAREHLGNDAVLFTVDKPIAPNFQCGMIPGIFPTIELRPISVENTKSAFNYQQNYAKGPPVASQYVVTTTRYWGKNVSREYSDDDIIQNANLAYSLNASISFSLIHGGTNFGYWNGAENQYPVSTSHDSFAPIAESGDSTLLMIAIRNWVNNLIDWTTRPTKIPSNLPKTAYQDVKLSTFNSIPGFIVGTLPECWKSKEIPETFEHIRHGYGFAYYNTTIFECGNLYIPSFEDDAYFYLNGVFIGALYKSFANSHNNTIEIVGCLPEINTLEIVVENTGRIHGYPSRMSKGIQSGVYMFNITLTTWFNCHVPIETYMLPHSQPNEIHFEKFASGDNTPRQPAVYIGTLHIKEQPTDTFLDTRGWGKGIVTINQYNIGRYWSKVGPQQTLYIPSEFLKKGSNMIMFYDFEGPTTACTVSSCVAKFTNRPILD